VPPNRDHLPHLLAQPGGGAAGDAKSSVFEVIARAALRRGIRKPEFNGFCKFAVFSQ